MPLTPLLTLQDLPSRFAPAESADELAKHRHQIAGWYRPVVLKLGAQPTTAYFSFENVEASRPSLFTLETVCHGSRFAWGWHERPDFGRLHPELASLDLQLLPRDLGLAVMDWVLENPLKSLEKVGLTLKLEDYSHTSIEASESDLGWKLALPEYQLAWTGVLRTDAKGMKLLADVINTVAPEIESSQAEHRLNTYLEWAHQLLRKEALAELKVHDLLLVNDQDRQAQKATFRVQNHDRGVAQYANDAWGLVGIDAPARALEEGYVLVQITSFPSASSLLELQQMKLATPLNFPMAPESRVLLWAEGRCFAEGEWIQMGDNSTVRIVDLKDA